MNLYAIQVNMLDPIMFLGFLNSSLTILVAGIFLLYALLPVIRRSQNEFNARILGVAFVLIAVYFMIFIIVSLLNPSYLMFLGLTDLWALAFIVPGLGLVRSKR